VCGEESDDAVLPTSPGSIAKGEALVKSAECILCHGDKLTGSDEVPRLAGLQPLYIARQLFDMQYGSSAGKAAALMKKAVAKSLMNQW
jgi:cytochrome c553